MEIPGLLKGLQKNYDDPKLKKDLWLEYYSWTRSLKSGRNRRDPKRRLFPSGAAYLMAQIYMGKRKVKK